MRFAKETIAAVARVRVGATAASRRVRPWKPGVHGIMKLLSLGRWRRGSRSANMLIQTKLVLISVISTRMYHSILLNKIILKKIKAGISRKSHISRESPR